MKTNWDWLIYPLPDELVAEVRRDDLSDRVRFLRHQLYEAPPGSMRRRALAFNLQMIEQFGRWLR